MLKRNSSRLYLHPAPLIVVAVFALALFWFLSKESAPPTETKTDSGVVEDKQVDQPVSPVVSEPEENVAEVKPTAPARKIPSPASAKEILSAKSRIVLGDREAEFLYYHDATADDITVAGAFDGWLDRRPLQLLRKGVWGVDVAGWNLEEGRYEFKFIVDGVWESGANRLLYINEDGKIQRPPDVVQRAVIDSPRQIRLVLKSPKKKDARVRLSSKPDLGRLRVEWTKPGGSSSESGYRLIEDDVEFVFEPGAYALSPDYLQTVHVAGNFNGWSTADSSYEMERKGDNFVLRRNLYNLKAVATHESVMFKFVVNGTLWQEPPEGVQNIMSEPGTEPRNLCIPNLSTLRPTMIVHTEKSIDLSNPPVLTVEGLAPVRLKVRPSPGDYFTRTRSGAELGAILNEDTTSTTFRLFAPRATKVELGLFNHPVAQEGEPPDITYIEPLETHLLTKIEKGVWEIEIPRLLPGQHYAYRISGPKGDGEGYNDKIWTGDPYAKAMANAEGNSIVVDLDEENEWFDGWTPNTRFNMPEWQDMVIYETHVRHLTADASSGVPTDRRGTYLGLLDTEGQGTGLDHLKDMGVNVIEFMPLQEFTNSRTNRHDWGYGPSFYFAPEASYATKPDSGSQVHEFRELVDELHKRGFGVFVDVVYNHVGAVNVFSLIDRKYYFRLNPDLTHQNFSGCGNDLRSESEMMRRLIVDSVRYWVETYHVDGFRFDLAELIDMETLKLIEYDIRQTHPNVVLISEPWSFRGGHKHKLKGTGWSAWNDEFRDSCKHFITGKGDKDRLVKAVEGSVKSWTAHPLQSVNYLESHDDHALVDELTDQPGHDGRTLTDRDLRIHKLGATILFTSLGMPMVGEGQMFLRSKHGVKNTYNKGDALNALRWEERERPIAKEVMDYYKQVIAFRRNSAADALRITNQPEADYVEFFGEGDQELGYLINANGQVSSPSILVLVNAGEAETSIKVKLPPGIWGQVGDGEDIHASGLQSARFAGDRSHKIDVPAQTALIYRNGF